MKNFGLNKEVWLTVEGLYVSCIMSYVLIVLATFYCCLYLHGVNINRAQGSDREKMVLDNTCDL